LLTWQSRRVLLFRADGKINGIISSYGDVFDKENTFIEQMSGWHKSSERTNAEKYIPNLHNTSRSLWRDLESILPQVDEANIKENRVSGTIIWPSILKSQDLIDGSYINICAVGAEYGPMQGVINELISDSVSVNANIITNIGRPWLKRIFDNIKKTDQCVWGLGTLAFDLAAASGNDDTNNKKGISAAAREQAYYSLDIPFRNWLAHIDPQVDQMEETSANWLKLMKHTILKMGEQLVAETGSRAITGTYKKDAKTNRTDINNAAKAYSKFKNNIYRIVEGGGN
jgi:CRISPR system Cascade subunit CasA